MAVPSPDATAVPVATDDVSGTEDFEEDFAAIRKEFERIAESYLEFGASDGSPTPLLKDKELIGLLHPLFEESERDIRPSAWVRPRLGKFMQRFDQAFHGQDLRSKLAKARRWQQELTTARDVLFEKSQTRRADHLRSFRRKDMWVTLGIFLGICILGAAAGLAQAGIFPWPVAAAIVVAYVVVYIFLSLQ